MGSPRSASGWPHLSRVFRIPFSLTTKAPPANYGPSPTGTASLPLKQRLPQALNETSVGLNIRMELSKSHRGVVRRNGQVHLSSTMRTTRAKLGGGGGQGTNLALKEMGSTQTTTVPALTTLRQPQQKVLRDVQKCSGATHAADPRYIVLPFLNSKRSCRIPQSGSKLRRIRSKRFQSAQKSGRLERMLFRSSLFSTVWNPASATLRPPSCQWDGLCQHIK